MPSSLNKKTVFIVCAVSLFLWALYLKSTSNQGAMPKNLDAPATTSTSAPLNSDPTPETQAPPSQAVMKDPFKEFLDAKERSTQSAQSPQPPPEKPFVPGTDPFKAKLEEQKNTPHSAVSPFKN
jgi:hypothetical protein